MTTFVPPQLIRSTGRLTVEKITIQPLTGVAGDLTLDTDLAAIGDIHKISFVAHDDGGNNTEYASLNAEILDDTDATEDGALRLETMQAGSATEVGTFAVGLTMLGATGGDQGSGTINATGVYVNGVALSSTSGDVVGPGSATDNAVARFDTTTGKLIQNSGVSIDDSNNVTGVNDLTVGGNLDVNGTLTTLDTTNLAVEDSLIQMARANSTTDTLDIGFVGLYDTSGSQDLYAGLFRDASDDKFHLFKSSQEDLSTANVVNKAATGYAVATLVADLEGTATGNVANTLFDANTILAATTDDTPAALTVGASTFVGRKSTGNIAAMSKAEALTELNVEDGADVTDATNVNAAGAVMEADYDANTILAATTDDTPAALTVGASTFVGRKAAGNISAMSVAEAQTLLNVEDGSQANLTWQSAIRTDGVDFTAGSSTTLTLPVAAPSDDEDHVRVYYHGVKQHADQWTISGTTLTVSTIPAGITDIELQVLA